jgi:hypothetical protein
VTRAELVSELVAQIREALPDPTPADVGWVAEVEEIMQTAPLPVLWEIYSTNGVRKAILKAIQAALIACRGMDGAGPHSLIVRVPCPMCDCFPCICNSVDQSS